MDSINQSLAKSKIQMNTISICFWIYELYLGYPYSSCISSSDTKSSTKPFQHPKPRHDILLQPGLTVCHREDISHPCYTKLILATGELKCGCGGQDVACLSLDCSKPTKYDIIEEAGGVITMRQFMPMSNFQNALDIVMFKKIKAQHGIKKNSTKPTKDHTEPHKPGKPPGKPSPVKLPSGKARYIAAVVVVMILLLVGIYIFKKTGKSETTA